jgi:4-amino-4-deoxy-L-arabinose transferase-like glycosyltransferase
MSVPKVEDKSTHFTHTAQSSKWLVLVILIALGVRLLAIDRPLVGNFATKNVVYAMIARNWVEGRASFWLPRIDCLCGGQRGLHLLELPLSAYLAGGLWRLAGGSLDVWGRLVSVAFSLGAVLVLFNLVRRRHGPSAALGAATVLALSPVAVIYGQAFMLESSVLFFAVATIDALDRWLTGSRLIWLLAAVLIFSLLVLTKIYMLVMLLPIGCMLLHRVRARTHQRDEGLLTGCLGQSEAVGCLGQSEAMAQCRAGNLFLRKHALYAIFAFLIAALPAVIWVLYVIRASLPGGPLADQVFYSLANSAEAHRPPHPLLFQADCYRRLLDDLATVVLTPVAFMLPLVGLLDRNWRRWAAWLAAMAILVAFMPRKFYEMNYYYVVVLPPIAVLAGLGWARLEEGLRPSRVAIAGLAILTIVVSLRYTFVPVLRTPAEDRAVLPAAQAVRALAAPGEPIATMHGDGVDLLYYCDRPGWALSPDDPDLAARLAECRRAGARFLAIVDVESHSSPDRPSRLPLCPPVAEGDGFRIYEISGEKP